MSGDNDKSNQKDPSAGKTPEGENLSSFLKDKAPTMSRILQEEEQRAAALAAGDGSDELDMALEEDDAEPPVEDPFVIVEEESFDISFDHLGDDETGDGDEQKPTFAPQADETPEENGSDTDTPAVDSEDDEFDEDDLGPPLPDLSGPAIEEPATDAQTGDGETDDLAETDAAPVDPGPVEPDPVEPDPVEPDPVETVDSDATEATLAEDRADETPENAEPLNLSEFDEGPDNAIGDDAEQGIPEDEPAEIEELAAEDSPLEDSQHDDSASEEPTREEPVPEEPAPEDTDEEDADEEDVPDIEMVDIDDVLTEEAEPEAAAESASEPAPDLTPQPTDAEPSEPEDEFAAWGEDDDDEDLGPPLPDLSAPDGEEADSAMLDPMDDGAADDSASDDVPDGEGTADDDASDDDAASDENAGDDIAADEAASGEDDWPDASDIPEPESADTEADTLDADLDEAEEELTLEIEGLEFQPGDLVDKAAEDTAPADELPSTDQTDPDDQPAPEPDLTDDASVDAEPEAATPEPAPEAGPESVPEPAPGIAEPPKPVSVQEALMAAIELHRNGDLAGAARGYEALVRRFPNSAAGWINLGIVLRRLGRLDAALACLRRGVMLNPNDGAAWSNLGNALRASNYLEDAKRAQLKALSLTPGAAQIHYNMGLVTRDFGELAEADACFRRAELLGYDNPDLPWDQSLTVLLSGNLEKGFEAYEARWDLPETQQRYAALPRWHGEAEKDKTIVIHAEQGLGDSLQFCRYVPTLKSRVGRLVFEVQPQLIDLLTASPLFDGVEIRARNHELVEADMQMPLLSAPNLLPLGESVLPGREPYLTPPPDGPRIGDNGTGPRIGIAWAGKPTHKNDANRSAGLSAFTALFDVLNARFYSLQVGPAQAEIQDLSLGAVIQDLSPAIRSFADTASLLQDLDVVVTVDTSVAHLAGAMGKPVWVMLPFAPDWRWQLRREDSPWYPSMRLFRQTSPGDWDEVFMRVRAALDDWIADRDSAEGASET
ncbi:tetratricopeptide repeat protein [Hwanghaeella grinnelliae]|uniref:Tetratricopeptide repeat protein n=1 Tax=Hwanghaeella grinnelliae TaxID=2500179 RepID=A0A3S2Y418_9PROT|nr:tetratricopeptide repeat protein [Hwanghaeella grinnelliae]RVU37961.1 tetratricopeptide repeat protein [Hwanghaeella grinnelliae]